MKTVNEKLYVEKVKRGKDEDANGQLTLEEIKEALALEDEAVKVVDLKRPGRRPRLTDGSNG